jgi:hypothetical protein
MSSVFQHLTLNLIGTGLFVAGLGLLVAGAAGVVISAASGGSNVFWVVGLSGGQALLVGLACFVASTMAFAHAITHARLSLLEARLNALASERAAEELAAAYSAESGAPAVRPSD